jgi:acyl-CoA reductase-like NAD-dependent aldehyde dehydrogenase
MIPLHHDPWFTFRFADDRLIPRFHLDGVEVGRRVKVFRIANDTSFGLHAFVSGTDVQRERRVASQILAGRVAINGMLDDQQAPFGGFKHSGVGREFGTFGIEAFLEPRAILE